MGAVHDRLLTRGAGGGGALGAARNPYGRHGSPAHRAKVKQRAEELEQQGYKITGGGGGREVAVPTPGGKKSRRFPDISAEGPDGRPYYENIYKPTRTGGIPKREIDAAKDIEKATGIPVVLTPY